MNEDESSYLNAVEEVLSGEVRQADVYGHYSVKEAAYIGVAMMLVTRYKLNNDNVVQEKGITEALKNLLVKCLLGAGNRSHDDFAALGSRQKASVMLRESLNSIRQREDMSSSPSSRLHLACWK